jgi:hypothetical protein
VRAALAVVGLLGGFLLDLLAPVCCGALNFVTRTPPELSYANPAVLALWGTARAAANASLALVALWGGVLLMAHHQLGLPHFGAAALFPRLAVGALLANTSLWWTALAIELNNGLAGLVGLGDPFPDWQRLTALDRASTDGIALLVYGGWACCWCCSRRPAWRCWPCCSRSPRWPRCAGCCPRHSAGRICGRTSSRARSSCSSCRRPR